MLAHRKSADDPSLQLWVMTRTEVNGYSQGVAAAMRPAKSTAGRNTTCGLTTPTRGFTAVVSVFKGTPPIKPIKMFAVRPLRFAGFSADLRPHWGTDHHPGRIIAPGGFEGKK
jgi:hypothetical protein